MKKNFRQILTPLTGCPPLTTEGKNTFGCLVNGEAFVTRVSTDAVAFVVQGSLQVGGGIEEPGKDQNINIFLRDIIPHGVGVYELSNDPSRSATFNDSAIQPWCLAEEKDLLEGVVEIVFFRYDPDVVSGTFEFTTVSETCDTIRVTDGRFDIDFI